MIVVVFLLALVVGFVASLVEGLLVWWIGPYTGIGYFDTATYWNVFFLVSIGNIVVGVSSFANRSD